MTSLIDFFKEAREELAKVTWPTFPEAMRMTALVIVISLAVGLYLAALDFAYREGLQYMLELFGSENAQQINRQISPQDIQTSPGGSGAPIEVNPQETNNSS